MYPQVECVERTGESRAHHRHGSGGKVKSSQKPLGSEGEASMKLLNNLCNFAEK